MLAVRMVLEKNMTYKETGDILMKCPEWVGKWVSRFREGDIDALRDLPRTGRPPRVPIKKLHKIISNISKITLVQLQQHIKEKIDEKFHITYVRKLLHMCKKSPKRATHLHVNGASKSEIIHWKSNTKHLISYLEDQGYTIAQEDEAIFVADDTDGSKFWTDVGKSFSIPYTGKRIKTVVFGLITKDKKQLFMTCDKSNTSTFIKFLNACRRKFGKIAIILDGATSHRSKRLKKWLRDHQELKLIYLPKATPQLNAVEQCWNQIKRIMMVSEFYPTLKDLKKSLSEYLRTVRFKLDINTYIFRPTADQSLQDPSPLVNPCKIPYQCRHTDESILCTALEALWRALLLF